MQFMTQIVIYILFFRCPSILLLSHISLIFLCANIYMYIVIGEEERKMAYNINRCDPHPTYIRNVKFLFDADSPSLISQRCAGLSFGWFLIFVCFFLRCKIDLLRMDTTTRLIRFLFASLVFHYCIYLYSIRMRSNCLFHLRSRVTYFYWLPYI